MPCFGRLGLLLLLFVVVLGGLVVYSTALGIEPKVSHMLGNPSTMELHLQPSCSFYFETEFQ